MPKETTNAQTFDWISLRSPSHTEILSLRELFPFSERDLEAILPLSRRSRIDFRDGYTLAMIVFPVYDVETGRVSSAEADFLITDHHFISVTREDAPELEHFFREVRNAHGENLKAHPTPMHLAIATFHSILSSLLPVTEAFAGQVDEIEHRLFRRRLQHGIVHDGTRLNLAFLELLKRLKPIKEVLAELERRVDREQHPQAEETRELAEHLVSLIESEDAVLDELQRTYDSLVSMRTNAIVKTLTVLSVMLLPLNAIASIFGMNFKNIPLVDLHNGFWILVSFMAMLVVFMGILFRRKRWL